MRFRNDVAPIAIWHAPWPSPFSDQEVATRLIVGELICQCVLFRLFKYVCATLVRRLQSVTCRGTQHSVTTQSTMDCLVTERYANARFSGFLNFK